LDRRISQYLGFEDVARTRVTLVSSQTYTCFAQQKNKLAFMLRK